MDAVRKFATEQGAEVVRIVEQLPRYAGSYPSMLEEVKESKHNLETADIVLCIEEDVDGYELLRVVKNRFGTTGWVLQ